MKRAKTTAAKPTGRRVKIATARDYATAKFEPWPARPDGHLIPRRETLAGLGLMARAACGIVLKTRPELIENCREMSEERALGLLDDLWKTEEALKEISEMVKIAHLRTLAALHVVDAERRSSKRQRAFGAGDDDGRAAS
jgi:hypothetical protein